MGRRSQIAELRQSTRAMSEPKGPVYLWARREVMEEEVDESLSKKPTDLKLWSPVEPLALSPSGL